jgi:hypothetical protein
MLAIAAALVFVRSKNRRTLPHFAAALSALQTFYNGACSSM